MYSLSASRHSFSSKPSRILQRFIQLSLLLFSLPLIWLHPLGIELQLLLLLVLVKYARLSYQHNRACRFTDQQNGAWQVYLSRGEVVQCRLLPGSVLSPLLAILYFRPLQAKRFSPVICCVLFADSIDAQSFRRLRLRLKLSSGEGHDQP